MRSWPCCVRMLAAHMQYLVHKLEVVHHAVEVLTNQQSHSHNLPETAQLYLFVRVCRCTGSRPSAWGDIRRVYNSASATLFSSLAAPYAAGRCSEVCVLRQDVALRVPGKLCCKRVGELRGAMHAAPYHA